MYQSLPTSVICVSPYVPLPVPLPVFMYSPPPPIVFGVRRYFHPYIVCVTPCNSMYFSVFPSVFHSIVNLIVYPPTFVSPLCFPIYISLLSFHVLCYISFHLYVFLRVTLRVFFFMPLRATLRVFVFMSLCLLLCVPPCIPLSVPQCVYAKVIVPFLTPGRRVLLLISVRRVDEDKGWKKYYITVNFVFGFSMLR